jgi:hypothetical protein
MNKIEKDLQNSGYAISTYLFPFVDTETLNSCIIESTDCKSEVTGLVRLHTS